jgi:hypothetical protein
MEFTGSGLEERLAGHFELEKKNPRSNAGMRKLLE